ncbi:hypothetical protein NPIL_52321 [Nephila pilipes]|uniref:Uncharacterized protein n=1 Tax=Nephila pilipes TaxID=299642 RepID=A0A8X6TYI5_NEPPI|nr:hypothetical protein NPIL_52321 [Nephila pilipes]
MKNVPVNVKHQVECLKSLVKRNDKKMAPEIPSTSPSTPKSKRFSVSYESKNFKSEPFKMFGQKKNTLIIITSFRETTDVERDALVLFVECAATLKGSWFTRLERESEEYGPKGEQSWTKLLSLHLTRKYHENSDFV